MPDLSNDPVWGEAARALSAALNGANLMLRHGAVSAEISSGARRVEFCALPTFPGVAFEVHWDGDGEAGGLLLDDGCDPKAVFPQWVRWVKGWRKKPPLAPHTVFYREKANSEALGPSP